MSAMIAPADEAGIIAAVQAARAACEPLAIEGQGFGLFVEGVWTRCEDFTGLLRVGAP